MSLATNLSNLSTRIATEFKAVKTSIGLLANLNTTTKTNLVAAINEVKVTADQAAAIGAGINDTTPGTTTTYSGSKIEALVTAAVAGVLDGAPGALNTLNELATALGNDANFATTLTNALAARVRTDVNNQGLTTTEQGNARTNIAAAAATHTHALTGSDLTGSLPITKGGTGSTTAAAARTALGVTASTDIGDTEQNLVTIFETGLL